VIRKLLPVLLVLSAAAVPALAEEGGMGLRSWGPRVGVADDPDQIVGGIQWDIGDMARHLRFVPNFEIGFGDDHTLVVINAPVHYVFRNVEAAVVPYAGGGIALGWVYKDKDKGDSSDFEIGLKGIGGVEWRLKGGTDFFLELNLVFGDLHDIQVLAGWSFKTNRGSGQP